MAPHPIIMYALHDDRRRTVDTELTRRSLRAYCDEAPDDDPAITRRRPGLRPLAFLTLAFRPRKSAAAGAPV